MVEPLQVRDAMREQTEDVVVPLPGSVVSARIAVVFLMEIFATAYKISGHIP